MNTANESGRTYLNPLIHLNAPHTWENYGVGDPFVMRYNGRYYLYCSTKDHFVGIQCWISDDLTAWTYAGICAEEKLTTSAYAPEVVYYNGVFYMYTSPAGQGHYVLTSPSPTGPFTAVTENFGLSIDGDVFIDDDGKWYFYSAGFHGIRGYVMTSPTEVDASSGVDTGAYMNGWTEGSMILKYGGKYYMTYTGNHVWCDGYRIDCAVSETTPLAFTPLKNNPILLSADPAKVKGIGHSSTVLAPDLDGYYIVYHSSPGVPKRELNMDRIVLNGNRLDVLGPTRFPQPCSRMPQVHTRFASAQGWIFRNAEPDPVNERLIVRAGGQAFAETFFADEYTAEINLLSLEEEAGVYFDYRDRKHYGRACFDADKQMLNVSITSDGETSIYTASVTGSFGEKLRCDALLCLTVRRYGGMGTLLVNGRQILTFETPLTGGLVGVTAVRGEAVFGYVGISSCVMQSGVKALAKPVDGCLPAVTALENDLHPVMYDGVQFVHACAGDKYSYRVNVEEDGIFDLAVRYRSENGALLALFDDRGAAGEIFLDAAENIALVRGIRLSGGMGTMVFRVLSGCADILSYTFLRAREISYVSDADAAYTDGNWNYEDGVLKLCDLYGKRLVGEEGWGDYTVEADITPTSENICFGLLVRAKNPSKGGANNSVPDGTYFTEGYFAGLGNGMVFLDKLRYSCTRLCTAAADVHAGASYHLSVTAEKASLTVYLNGTEVLRYTDADAWVQGRAGVRGQNSTGEVRNFTVYPNK